RISTDLSVFALVLVISISIRGFVSMNLIAKGVLLVVFVIKSLLSVTLLPFCLFKLLNHTGWLSLRPCGNPHKQCRRSTSLMTITRPHCNEVWNEGIVLSTPSLAQQR